VLKKQSKCSKKLSNLVTLQITIKENDLPKNTFSTINN
jgi:hypothetical protein